MDASADPKFMVLILTINRQIHTFECGHCIQLIDLDQQEKAKKILRLDVGEAFRFTMSEIFPRLIVRRKYSTKRPQWFTPFTESSKSRKKYIVDPYNDRRVFGYSTGWAQSVVAIAHAHGRKPEVLHIGIDIMQLAVPAKVPILKFVESYSHKLTRHEEAVLELKMKEDVIIRRLCVLLTIKAAYVKAVGFPPGFDYSRLDCDIPQETVRFDGKPIIGWEFRLFKVNLGVLRNGVLIEETYQCSTAMFRGGNKTSFIWEEDPKAMSNWMTFLNLDQMLHILSAPRTPPIATSSAKSSPTLYS